MNTFYVSSFLASVSTKPAEAWPEASTIVWQILLIIFLVLLNGFFVAAEFALVKVRTTQLDEAVDEERSGSKTARHMMDHLDIYLSATQLGITMASVLLSMFGEKYVSKLIEPIFLKIGWNLEPSTITWTAFLISFSLLTVMHVVVGEMMPKSYAIRKSLSTTLFISRPLKIFSWAFGWLNKPLTALANKMLKIFFRMEGISDHHAVHSGEELQFLVEESGKNLRVTALERDISVNALELNERVVRDIMTPRTEIVYMDVEDDFETNLNLALESQHTRFPLRDRSLDNVPGVVHIKDLLRAIRQEKSPDLKKLSREPAWLTEIQPLDEALRHFLNTQSHLALVLDENSVLTGMVTLDDVLEELVGEIRDEFDTEVTRFEKLENGEFLVDGKFPLYELTDFVEDLEISLPQVSTLNGYLMAKLHRLPKKEDVVELEDTGYEACVDKMEGRRVTKVRIRKISAKSPTEEVTAEADSANS